MTRPNSALGPAFLFAALVLNAPTPAPAQEIDRRSGRAPLGQRPETFGSAEVTHTVPSYAFTGFEAEDSSRFRAGADYHRYCEGADCTFVAPLLLPAGAHVTQIEVAACDSNASGFVTATLFRHNSPEGGAVGLVSAFTTLSETPGCVFRASVGGAAEPIDNYFYVYHVRVAILGTDINTSFQAVRIYYTLQVSPAPAVATFNDVPTSHPFFQVIEAMAASGITAGCSASPPLYCPNSPVTRAQMAAFFSVALGLHWR